MNKTDETAPKWFIVKARPTFETKAGEEILALGQTVYVPQFRKEYKHARTKAWISKYYPVLRGYIFVLASQQWGRVLTCESVTGVLRSTDRGEAVDPIPISDIEVRSIRERQEAGDFDHLRVDGQLMKIGDMVKIGEGSLAGQRGEVAAINDNNIVMWISAFGGKTKTSVPIEILRQTS
jgi:transcription termination/antitermination protein NusG